MGTVFIAVDRAVTGNGCLNVSDHRQCSQPTHSLTSILTYVYVLYCFGKYMYLYSQIIPGSHKCGRLEHNNSGGQFQADLDRVNAVKEKLGVLPVEMEPGIYNS